MNIPHKKATEVAAGVSQRTGMSLEDVAKGLMALFDSKQDQPHADSGVSEGAEKYSMNPKYKALARKHWARWQPKRVAELKAKGLLDQTLQTAAVQATRRVVELMERGYQVHEAEEVALREFVLLAPEENPNDPEVIEQRKLERAYRKQMRKEQAIQDEADQ
ncbi:hypothetical protein [Aquabacterium sp.]|uniref:hypothetical protein n=1 Tax=Aquabacterium sp. TaxID=1872578 RepID=UPI0035ADD6EB